MLKKLFGKASDEFSQPKDTLAVVVSSKKTIADKIVELELRSPESGDLPAFTAGSHIDLHLAKDQMRQYSLANNPTEKDRYLCAVLIEEEGTGGSKAVAEKVQEGDRLFVSNPRNHFALSEDAEHSILIAGGIGVTPLLAMAYRLKQQGKSFKFYYRCRTRSRAAYAELLVQEFADSVECFFSDEGGREMFDLIRIMEDVPPNTHLYTCGGNDFMDQVVEAAKTRLPEEQIHLEHFHPPEIENQGEDAGFELYCTKSDKRLQVPADKSIVEVLDENGIDIPISCTEGICGSCITHFTEGEVDHRDFILSKSEKEKKRLFTPCCSRAAGPRLAIDI